MSTRRLLTVAREVGGLAGAAARRAATPRARRGDAGGGDGGADAAKDVRLALERLGPFYVKVGQMLSTRPDIVPPAIMAELATLHDHVSVVPFSAFEPVLAAELGPRWTGRFRDIDTRPLGSASLAQAYRVVTSDGRGAVLKVQRPDIGALVLDDMATMRRVARVLARAFPAFNTVIDIEAALGVVFDAMAAELDFTVEAANMRRARALVAAFEHIDVPGVLWATPRAMVQTLAPGTSIRDADRRTLSEEQRTGIGRDLLALMYRGYFADRFFHADPHPGNILVAPGEKAHLIDWGMVGRVDRRMSMTMMTVLLSLAHNDGPGLARAWLELGKATPWADIAGFSGDMAILVPKVATASLDELNFGVTLTSVLKYATKRGIQTSPVVSLLGKSFANIEGSVRYLAPELALTEVFEEQLRGILFHLARESLSEIQAARTALDLMIGGTVAPEQLRGLARDTANRELTVRMGPGLGRSRRRRALGALGTPAAALTAGALLWEARRGRSAACASCEGR